jgi:hypothetical protein
MCVLSNEEERRRRKPEGLTAIGEVEKGESTRRLAVCRWTGWKRCLKSFKMPAS